METRGYSGKDMARCINSSDRSDPVSVEGASVVAIRRSDFSNSLIHDFEQLLRDESFVDVTLVISNAPLGTGGVNQRLQPFSVQAHKVILSACSPLFKHLLLENPCHHPIVFLPVEITPQDLGYIMDFIYNGQVDVLQSDIESVLKAGAILQIKGLSQKEALPEKSQKSRVTAEEETPHHSRRKSSPRFRFMKKKKEGSRLWKRALSSLEKESSDDSLPQNKLHCSDDENAPIDFTTKVVGSLEKNLTSSESLQSRNPIKIENAASPIADEHLPSNSSPCHVDLSSSYFNDDLGDAFPTMVRPIQHNPFLSGENGSHFLDLEDRFGEDPMDESSDLHKGYTKKELKLALDALKAKNMTLTKASEFFNIPPTTLWQRANRMGISTPKRETVNKTWNDEVLNEALDALRSKRISANKAAKQFGIPASTLYKIARKERIELAQPFNAVQTSWSQEDLRKALNAIKKGIPVQKASTEFGIPSGTLYGRCKKFGIELTKSTAAHWSEEEMVKALHSVKSGAMSINQAAIHYNLPYSSLYGRINRLKKENPMEWCAFLNENDIMSQTSDTNTKENSQNVTLASFPAFGSLSWNSDCKKNK